MSKFSQLIERVDADARELRPHLVVLTIIAAVLFAIGWLVGIVLRGVWMLFAWAWAACKVGFKAGRGSES